MKPLILLVTNQLIQGHGYLIGAFISLLILAYLIVALIKPDKF